MKKLRLMNPKDVDEKLRELRLELAREKGFSEIGTVKNPGKVKDLRRTVARILTFKASKKKKIIKKEK